MRSVEEIKADIENPIESLKNTIPFSCRDWSTEKRDAWVYGIVCGWDDDCYAEFQIKFGWDKKTFERLKRLHLVFDRFEAICNAEREGRCVVLPCKVGDRLYILTSDSLTGIEETKCKRINVRTLQDGVIAKIIAPCTIDDWGGAYRELYAENFGKTVFLDRESAENALKGEKG